VLESVRVDLYAELDALVRGFDAQSIDYALCGGLALAVHGLPRATRDIDILARRVDLDRIREVVKACGFTIEALPMTFSSSGRTVVRFTKLGDGEPLMVDILLVEDPPDAAWETRSRVPYERGHISVVSRQGLITLKLLAGRPQDLADIARLTELTDG
jgi:hypothetical protein